MIKEEVCLAHLLGLHPHLHKHVGAHVNGNLEEAITIAQKLKFTIENPVASEGRAITKTTKNVKKIRKRVLWPKFKAKSQRHHLRLILFSSKR